MIEAVRSSISCSRFQSSGESLIRQPGVTAPFIANYQDGGLGDWMARAAALGEEDRPAIGMPQADVEYFGDLAIVIISHGHGSFILVVGGGEHGR
jgi:hypothetical protein